MVLIIECIVISILFSLGIFIPLYKNPIGQIMSYPASIRKRVESLPQYRDSIQRRENKHLIIKVLGIFIFAAILGAVAYLSDAKTFIDAFWHVFIIFFVVNLYDLFIMDLLIFRNVKAFRIPGTEDMDKEYKECWHHIRGAGIGICIGTVVSFLSGLLVELVNCLI